MLAYIKGRSLVFQDYTSGQPKVIQRDSLLHSVAINHESTLLAVGDDFGKIFLVHPATTKQTLIQSLHWHAHKVSALLFMPDTPFLLSAGEESVIVQWHLQTQSKTFISRIGQGPIRNMSLSLPDNTYYATTLDDNSVKVVRFDNNKTQINVKHL